MIRAKDDWDEEEVYEFLDELRASGVTNMTGGGVYLQREFGMERTEARAWLKRWMDTFGERRDRGETYA